MKDQRALDQDLLNAYERQHWDAVSIALEAGASPKAAFERGPPLLCVAIADGRLAIAKDLIDRGADLDASEGGLDAPLIEAFEALSYQKFSQKPDVGSYIDILLLLIERGASPHQRSEHSMTPLALSGSFNRRAAKEENIRSGSPFVGGAEIDDWASALMWAAGLNCEPALRALLDAGARVNELDNHGVSALGYACAWGALESMALLIEAGADVRMGSEGANAPMTLAINSNRAEAAGLLDAARQRIEIEGALGLGERVKKASPRV